MNIVMNGPSLVLDRLEHFALKDAAGTIAQVKSGRVWITLEHDRRDIVLEPGETWVIDRDGLTLVQAEEPTTVVLQEPKGTRSAAAALWRRCRDAMTQWTTRYTRRSAPYY